MFGISDKDMLDKNKIKVIDSIAGAGKSTATDMFFKKYGISYHRYTSTNQLKNDAIERFGCETKTIASGLFTTEDYHFYSKFKDVECEHVVIDEILQADPKSLDWVIENVGKCNIIVTCDSHQMLAPESEEKMLSKFQELISRDDVIYVNVTETKRARDSKTKAIFESMYKVATTDSNIHASKLAKMFKSINYEDMDFNTTDAYITHTKSIEDFLYKDKELTKRVHELDLIAKGRISSRVPKAIYTYPLLSQFEAEKTKAQSYVQVKNIGTPTRYQGSEVVAGNKLYYLVASNSQISARELYTVLTRLWLIDDLVIVFCNPPKDENIKKFKGLPVKHETFLLLDYSGDTLVYSDKMMDNFWKKYPDSDEIYYNKDVVYSKNGYIAIHRDSYEVKSEGKKGGKRKQTASSLIKRDGSLNFSYVSQIYEILDMHNIDNLKSVRPKKLFSGDSVYQVDLFSAYPHILKYAEMPCDGILSDTYDKDMLNFYRVKSDYVTSDAVITEDLANYIKTNGMGEVEYLFSTPKQKGCFIGEYLWNKSHSNIESKAELKEIHYGFWERHFLELSPDESCYLINEYQKYEILMCTITSQLLFYMFQLKEALSANYIIVDAVHFDNFDDTTVDTVKSILPEWLHWRIKENETGNVLYQTFEDLKTKKDIQKDKAKERRKNLSEEKKEEIKRKKREYMANKRSQGK